MIRLPYGNADFYKIIQEDYFYIDRTAAIETMESVGSVLLFLRPRRFGKSLWVSVLHNYYDIRRAPEFDLLFGHLAIGQKPTPRHNKYFILKWNFSLIDTTGDIPEIKQQLHNHLNGQAEQFIQVYRDYFDHEIQLDPTDGLRSFQSILAAVSRTPYKIYLLIDEYDNFANEVLMAGHGDSHERYEALVKGEGLLKTIFRAIKFGTEGQGIDRVFITGVSPVVMSDITSGFNISENIYSMHQFNDLCGFKETEVAAVLAQIGQQCHFSAEQVEEGLTMMRTFYNGYSFSYDLPPVAGGSSEKLPPVNLQGMWSSHQVTSSHLMTKSPNYLQGGKLYNPTLVLYFLKYLQRECKFPSQILDHNLAMDRNKIAYIAQLPHGYELITQLLGEHEPLVISQLANRFGVVEMLKPEHDTTFMASLLYFFGVVTLSRERTIYEELILQIPNLVIRKLYAEQLFELMLPLGQEIDEARQVTRQLYQKGEMGPLCEFIERKQFKVFANRDYEATNELTIKTVFLTLLFNDTFYIMDSEPAIGRHYGDLIMLVRPDLRHSALLDILIEFKYVPLGKHQLTGEQVAAMSQVELLALKPVQSALTKAKKQLKIYREKLQQVYGVGFLKLRCYVVVSVGYDRLVWQEYKSVVRKTSPQPSPT